MTSQLISFHIRKPGMLLRCFLVVSALVGLYFLPFPDSRPHLQDMLCSPSWHHPLGCDPMGRDLLGRLVLAVYQSTLPVWGVVLFAQLFGSICFLGIHHRRFPKQFFSLLYSFFGILNAVPMTILVLGMSVFLEKISFHQLLVVFFLFFLGSHLHKLQSLFMEDRLLGYWQSHEAMGGSLSMRISHYGFQGKWKKPLLESVSTNLSVAVLMEITLAYLGYGNQEPKASFGNIVSMHLPYLLEGRASLLMGILLPLMLILEFPGWLLHPFAFNQTHSKKSIHSEAPPFLEGVPVSVNCK